MPGSYILCKRHERDATRYGYDCKYYRQNFCRSFHIIKIRKNYDDKQADTANRLSPLSPSPKKMIDLLKEYPVVDQRPNNNKEGESVKVGFMLSKVFFYKESIYNPENV